MYEVQKSANFQFRFWTPPPIEYVAENCTFEKNEFHISLPKI